MIAVEHILQFIDQARHDVRMRPLHVSLYLAMYQVWVVNNCINPINISRSSLMSIAKINSIATYHKGMNDLQSFGYISYLPSYDPRVKTLVHFLSISKEATSAEIAPTC